MDSRQIAQAAYVNAQSTCAMIEAMGFVAENQQRALKGESPAYTHKQFYNLIISYGIYHNATVTDLFRG